MNYKFKALGIPQITYPEVYGKNEVCVYIYVE